jgi:hypothetical protein
VGCTGAARGKSYAARGELGAGVLSKRGGKCCSQISAKYMKARGKMPGATREGGRPQNNDAPNSQDTVVSKRKSWRSAELNRRF